MKDFKEFDSAMDAEYMRHFPEKGDSWKTCEVEYLWSELHRITQYIPVNNVSHLLDIASVCRMIWTRYHSSASTLNWEEE